MAAPKFKPCNDCKSPANCGASKKCQNAGK